MGLLSPFLRKKLNPIKITLVACKDIPFKTEPKYKPIHAVFEFVDGKSFKSLTMPQQEHCKFDSKYVFLLGKQDPVQLKELLATKTVKVYLHDCDEYVDND